MKHLTLSAALLGTLASGVVGSASAQQAAPPRGIVNIAPDLYRAQNDNHYTVFLVTPEGIVIAQVYATMKGTN